MPDPTQQPHPSGDATAHPPHVETPDIPTSPRAIPAQLARGFLMGAADIVPGISGGTVALALGIYHQLVAALDRCVDVVTAVLRFDRRRIGPALARVPWLWMIGLGVGILIAVFALSNVLRGALATYPMQMAGLFLGLIAGATVLCWRQLLRATPATYVVAGLVAIGFFFFLGLAPSPETGVAPPLWVFFAAGAVAICAMILPGISGSFLLVLMGMYAHVLSAVADRDLLTLIVFALGCAVGISLAARGLAWLLQHYHDIILAAMIGLMVGSVRILWPWPGGLDSTDLALPTVGTFLWPTVLAVIGCAVVIAVDVLARRLSAD